MLFQFELMVVDNEPGKTKWYHQQWSLEDIKRVMTRWQNGLHTGWNSLYLENHDQPRSLSRFGNDKHPQFRNHSAKMLATWLHMMRGTPYIYQGQEIGMSNIAFDSIADYRDLESINYYNHELERGILSEDEIMKRIHIKSRDNARTPMQWNDQDNAGFSQGQPWIKVNPNYKEVNVQKDLSDPQSIFYHFQKLIKLRKQHHVAVYGDYQIIHSDHCDVYAYLRTLHNEQLFVMANFSDKWTTFTIPTYDKEKLLVPFSTCQVIVSVYGEEENTPYSSSFDFTQPISLPPYDARVYKLIRLESQSCRT